MKYFITPMFMLALLLSFLGCSPDDKPEAINYPVDTNIIGKWYLIGYDAGNGYVEYKNACSEKRDYLEFLATAQSIEQGYDDTCESGYTYNSTWKVTNGVYLSFDKGSIRNCIVSQLTGDRLGLQSQTQNSLGSNVTVTNFYSK